MKDHDGSSIFSMAYLRKIVIAPGTKIECEKYIVIGVLRSLLPKGRRSIKALSSTLTDSYNVISYSQLQSAGFILAKIKRS